MLDKAKISLIHTAKSKIKISDESYRDILGSFGVKSSTELSESQFLELMKIFEGLGFNNNFSAPAKKYETDRVDKFGNPLASYAQLKKIKATWANATGVRDRSPEALNNFTMRITGVARVEWVRMYDVYKLVKAIEVLR